MRRPPRNELVNNTRWISYPERRVGQQQLLRALLLGMRETDPRYAEYSSRLQHRRPGG